MVKSVSVDVNPKTTADACENWLSMFDVSVDGDGDVHVHVHAHAHVHVDEDVDADVDVDVAANKTEHVCSYY